MMANSSSEGYALASLCFVFSNEIHKWSVTLSAIKLNFSNKSSVDFLWSPDQVKPGSQSQHNKPETQPKDPDYIYHVVVSTMWMLVQSSY
jgi:hypothetical protein